MKQYMFNILVRVIVKRVKNGEDLQEILNSYSNLSGEDKVKIQNAVLTNLD